jgi:hypothetical protein
LFEELYEFLFLCAGVSFSGLPSAHAVTVERRGAQEIVHLNQEDRDRVINQNRALPEYSLEKSRQLVWQQLGRNFATASQERAKISSLNAMAKLVVYHRYQPVGIGRPFRHLLGYLKAFRLSILLTDLRILDWMV